MTYFKYPDNGFMRSQSEQLINILSPILYSRYKEKLDALALTEDWLNDAKISLPIDRQSSWLGRKDYNTLVQFHFPKSHPVLKGNVSIAYHRATFDEYFGELSLPELSYQEYAKLKSGEEIKAWWDNIFSDVFGEYYRKYGFVGYDYRFDVVKQISDKHFYIEVPNITEPHKLFSHHVFKDGRRVLTCAEHIEEITLTVKVKLPYSYAILPTEMDLMFVMRRETNNGDETIAP